MRSLLVSAFVLIFSSQQQLLSQGRHPLPRSPDKLEPRSGLVFKTPGAQRYAVPTRLPSIDFDIQQTYAGIMELGEAGDGYFFWLFPTTNPKVGYSKLTLWSNGGPGCSSLIGALQENGPILWRNGQPKATKNEHSWDRLSNMLYVEHPVDVGFSRGTTVTYTEDDITRLMIKFLTKFLDIFPEFKNTDFFLAGEAYAAYFLSYIGIMVAKQHAQLSLNLQGLLLIDPVIAPDCLTEDAPLMDFIKSNPKLFKDMKLPLGDLEAIDRKCGYTDFLNKSLTYPPPADLGFPKACTRTESGFYQVTKECSIYSKFVDSAPADFFYDNVYEKVSKSDILYDKTTYLDRPDVRKALNVRSTSSWTVCSNSSKILPNGDASAAPFEAVLPAIIDQTTRTVIAHGAFDAILFAKGTLLGIQSMTWGGKKGFQTAPNTDFKVQGQVEGYSHTERKLTFVEVNHAGHTLPGDNSPAAWQIFDFFLGNTPSLSS